MKPVAVIILGADVLLAAHPATPIQLWHGCLAAGYDLAVPATWGDELIAGECLRALASLPEPVAVMCSCPLVARALGDMPTDLSPHLIPIVAPPVAAAKYLRRVYGERRVHITYAGACPAAADSAIDAWIAPAELLDRFRSTEIVLETQPELFESILPPDRRRYLSLPGGLPAAGPAATVARPRRVVQITDDDLAAALDRHLASGVSALLDIGPRVGCACSGGASSLQPAEARAAVMSLEPPRSSRPVMADPGGLGLARRLPVRQPAQVSEPALVATQATATPADAKAEPHRIAAAAVGAATLSPLSWHLRERAHPQPSTTGRVNPARTPDTQRTAGASSAGWTARPPDLDRGDEATDAITVAAVRALENAASLSRAARTAGDAGGALAPSAPVVHRAVPVAALPDSQPSAVSPPTDTVAGRDTPTGEARPARATPPGGYWFAAPIVAGASDTEVRRPSAPLDAVPDDLAAPSGADSPDSSADPPVEEAAAISEAGPVTGASSEPPQESAELESVGAELSELFRRNEATVPPASASGPLPWRWLFGALLLMLVAIAITRRINSRVTVEDAGTSALVGGASTPHPFPVDAAPSERADPAQSGDARSPATASRVGESRNAAGSQGVAAEGTRVRRPTRPRTLVAPREGNPDTSSLQRPGAGAVPVALRADTMISSPVTPRTDSSRSAERQSTGAEAAGAVAPSLREIELRAIRDEIARRTARLDSMGRVINSLYVAPRSPGAVVPRPTLPPSVPPSRR